MDSYLLNRRRRHKAAAPSAGLKGQNYHLLTPQNFTVHCFRCVDIRSKKEGRSVQICDYCEKNTKECRYTNIHNCIPGPLILMKSDIIVCWKESSQLSMRNFKSERVCNRVVKINLRSGRTYRSTVLLLVHIQVAYCICISLLLLIYVSHPDSGP